MSRFKVLQPQTSTSALSKARKFIGFVESAAPMQHCGMEVGSGDLIASRFDVSHQRCEGILESGTMSLPAEEFPVLCRTLIGRELPEDPRKHVIRPDPELMSRLLKLHRTVGQLAHDTPDILELPEVTRALEQQLIHVMVSCLADNTAVDFSKSSQTHALVVRRFEEFLEANPDRPLYLTEICAAVGVAERTLRAACEDFLGMGPIRYLTLRRMHLVRRALLMAESSSQTVTRILTDHGFWEFGRFSVSYRALFGETPSETLRRPADQIAFNFNRPISFAANSGRGQISRFH
jgi:AraC-like DNA-binding protein